MTTNMTPFSADLIGGPCDNVECAVDAENSADWTVYDEAVFGPQAS